ncbi:MAG: hypothetical protein KBG84_06265 [Planctomycetes bacterium]|nr:hypothetical protein [Planctomycetota bacterium]
MSKSPEKRQATVSAWGYTEDGKKFVIPPRPVKVNFYKVTSLRAKKPADRKKAA